jgi:hypothetical protein
MHSTGSHPVEQSVQVQVLGELRCTGVPRTLRMRMGVLVSAYGSSFEHTEHNVQYFSTRPSSLHVFNRGCGSTGT